MDAGAIANGEMGPVAALPPAAAAGAALAAGCCCGCGGRRDCSSCGCALSESAARAKPTEVCLAMRRAMARTPTVRSCIAALAAWFVASAACRLTSPASGPYLEGMQHCF
jgi:hypothetical protein